MLDSKEANNLREYDEKFTTRKTQNGDSGLQIVAVWMKFPKNAWEKPERLVLFERT